MNLLDLRFWKYVRKHCKVFGELLKKPFLSDDRWKYSVHVMSDSAILEY
jgi:hypothetical protein